MAASRRPSPYNAAAPRGGFASHDAPVPANTAAPPHGLQQFNQMHDLLGTLDHYSSSSQQDYSTGTRTGPGPVPGPGAQHSHPREDELDLSPGRHHSLQHRFDVENVNDFQAPPAQTPWNPLKVGQHRSNADPLASQHSDLNFMYLTPNRQSACVPPDSAYGTLSQQDTHSEYSAGSAGFGRFNNNLSSVPRSIPPERRPRTSPQRPVFPNAMPSKPKSASQASAQKVDTNVGSFTCDAEEGCPWRGKTRSDLKKHSAQHALTHKCLMDNCNRNGKGFATSNDLIRHQMTVHKVEVPGHRLYKCFARGCSKPDKKWPRKDNFRAHLMKTHPQDDPLQLLSRSEKWWDDQSGEGMHVGDVNQTQATWAESGFPPEAYHQQGIQPATPQYHSSAPLDSDYFQSSPLTQAHQSPSYPFIPHGVDQSASLLPQEPQYQLQATFFQQIAANEYGYPTVSNANVTSRPSNTSSSRMQNSGSVPRSGHHGQRRRKASVASATQSADHGVSVSQPTHPSLPDAWATAFPPEPSNTHMSRNASYSHNNLQRPTQYSNFSQRANTIANTQDLQEQHRKMEESMAFEQAAAITKQDYPAQVNELSQMVEGIGQEFTGIPDITVTESTNNELSPEGLNRFLERFNTNPDQVINMLRSTLESRVSQAGTTASDISLTDVRPGKFIKEINKEGKKTTFKCTWPNCGSQKAEWELRSEIKKHIKRHTKPYGCTFENCYRHFGSKSDWIRHETKKHSQEECWRCDIKGCCQIFEKKDLFVAHLRSSKYHRLTDAQEMNTLLTQKHINATFQPQYWCGFCKRIRRLSQKGKPGIQERYDHIDHHITQEAKNIEDWLPPYGKLSKRKIREARQRGGAYRSDDERSDDGGDGGREDTRGTPVTSSEESISSADDAAPPPSPPTLDRMNQPSTQGASLASNSMSAGMMNASSTDESYWQQSNSMVSSFPSTAAPLPAQPAPRNNKRTAEAVGLEYSQQSAQRARRVPANMWKCHSCGSDWLLATTLICTECEHRRCPGCRCFA